jgi:dynein heavy chain 2
VIGIGTNGKIFQDFLEVIISTNIGLIILDAYFVSWPSSSGRRTLPPAGRILSRLSSKDLKPFVERGIGRYRAEYRDTDVFLFREILDTIVRCDRVLTTPGGSLLLAGRNGVGRHTAIGVVASMNNMKLFSPKVSRTYGIKQFKNDLKTVCLIYICNIDFVCVE